MSHPLATLEHASVGAPITRGNLSFFPVYLHGHAAPDVEAGVVALGNGSAVVSEHSGGVVATLEVENRGPRPVVFPEGDILVGGKQDRTLNVSVLIGAGAHTLLPVSCVEQGRWDSGSGYEPGNMMSPRRVRREKVRTVHENYSHDRRSNQGQVWGAIEEEFARTGGLSRTRAVRDALEARSDWLDQLAEIRPLPDQAGVVVTRGRRVLGVDVFGSPALLRSYWERILTSYVVDMSTRRPSTRPSLGVALRSVRHLMHPAVDVREGVGVGTEVAQRCSHLVASGVTLNGSLVHVSAFGLAA